MTYYIYLTTNPKKTVLYTGQTSNLRRRIREHYENRGKEGSFAGKYYCYNMLHIEEFSEMQHSIDRENEIKRMTREAKEQLISEANPKWFFLNDELFGVGWKNEPLRDEYVDKEEKQ